MCCEKMVYWALLCMSINNLLTIYCFGKTAVLPKAFCDVFINNAINSIFFRTYSISNISFTIDAILPVMGVSR